MKAHLEHAHDQGEVEIAARFHGREAAEAVNECESLCYQAEKMAADFARVRASWKLASMAAP